MKRKGTGKMTRRGLLQTGAGLALGGVLGTGDAPAGLRVSAHAFSATAREKITAAGGTVTEL